MEQREIPILTAATPDELPPPLPPAGPVKESARIDAIDAVRGFALLGIFLVNIQFFSNPFGKLMEGVPPENASVGDIIAFYFVRIFCEGKFYPLFSMLFGMGLMLQYGRAIQTRGRFVGIGLRRLFILMLFGAAHALLVWYGDILFIYSLYGMLLLFFLRCRPRTLFIMTAVCLALTLILGSLFFLIMYAVPSVNKATPATSATIEHFDDPFGRVWEGLEKKEIQDPSSPIWIQAETQAYRYGPYDQLFKFRAMSWAFVGISCLVGFGWEIAAMFFFGAGLLKAGLFTPERAHWLRRLFRVGLFLGLPLAIVAALAPRLIDGIWGQVTSGLILMVGGPLLSMGYLGGIALLVEHGYLQTVTRALANTGRMALTNYLTQSLIATTIFYYYGLGLYGQATALQRIGIVVSIYLLQVVFSSVWLRYFQFGPMEWLWRTLTYMRPQPMLRS
jgi:uncharacterized protein